MRDVLCCVQRADDKREGGRSKIDFAFVIHKIIGGGCTALHDLPPKLLQVPSERKRSWLATSLILSDVEKQMRGGGFG